MAYAFFQDVPIDTDVYWRIQAGLGDVPPAGFKAHVAMVRPEGGLRYLNVFESEDAWEAFADERLHPVVHPMVRELFGEVPPEPERQPVELVNLWVP